MARDDIREVANELVKKPGIILAMDESNSTFGKRLVALEEQFGVKLENTPEQRSRYRGMVVTTKMFPYVNAAILFEETLEQETDDGKRFVECLAEQGIVPIIKVDQGLAKDPNFPGQEVTKGLDGLAERLRGYWKMGARATKARSVIAIAENSPSHEFIEEVGRFQSSYAKICQEEGFAPIVEPEVMMDKGTHDIDLAEKVTREVLKSVIRHLKAEGVDMEGIVIKPNMVIYGSAYPGGFPPIGRYTVDVADRTVKVLKETVPDGVPGIAFLSGGQKDGEPTLHLRTMNQRHPNLPFRLTASFGREMQNNAMKEYAAGIKGNYDSTSKVQAALLQRARESSDASIGK